MKHILVVIFVFIVISIFSQEIDYAKVIQSGKWFPGFNITSKKVVYYRKPPGKTKDETVEFRKTGIMIRCAEEPETINKEDRKSTRTDYVCNSTQTYEIKNGMMQIRLLNQMPNFYKIQVLGETFELTPVKSEADDKQ